MKATKELLNFAIIGVEKELHKVQAKKKKTLKALNGDFKTSLTEYELKQMIENHNAQIDDLLLKMGKYKWELDTMTENG